LVFFLGPDPELFPDPDLADESGVLAVGGDLTVRRLLAAYARGIFPWYSERMPILWHCPEPRFVLEPAALHVPKSLRKQMRREVYDVRLDTAFEEVIDACAKTRRPGQRGTWITRDMRAAYCELHRLGYAHSCESWSDGKLAGGLYGVALGTVFFGESMFARAPDASKVAFASLVEQLVRWGFTLIDCQQETDHLARFGAEAWPRRRFLAALPGAVDAPTKKGRWSFDSDPPVGV
jgi:leucyl/phenylalanyl-tRNA--protein transferase